ncbi:MAG: riboflavin synthase [Myxococcota bacterium]|nr:riboflavin synthase [Myxococcota bacterium]
MFTGIVETTGRVVRIERRGELADLFVEAPALASEVALGDSVAVNGACLTIAESHPTELRFQAVLETLEKTSLGGLEEGGSVNLERAMRADARLDGHIVQGHVDGTGRVESLRREGDDVRLCIETTADFADLLVEKGSVAIDGVSLTVCDVGEKGFDVALIPHTLEITTLGRLEPGSRVNLEADVLGKYVKKYLGRLGLSGRDGEGAA